MSQTNQKHPIYYFAYGSGEILTHRIVRKYLEKYGEVHDFELSERRDFPWSLARFRLQNLSDFNSICSFREELRVNNHTFSVFRDNDRMFNQRVWLQKDALKYSKPCSAKDKSISLAQKKSTRKPASKNSEQNVDFKSFSSEKSSSESESSGSLDDIERAFKQGETLKKSTLVHNYSVRRVRRSSRGDKVHRDYRELSSSEASFTSRREMVESEEEWVPPESSSPSMHEKDCTSQENIFLPLQSTPEKSRCSSEEEGISVWLESSSSPGENSAGEEISTLEEQEFSRPEKLSPSYKSHHSEQSPSSLKCKKRFSEAQSAKEQSTSSKDELKEESAFLPEQKQTTNFSKVSNEETLSRTELQPNDLPKFSNSNVEEKADDEPSCARTVGKRYGKMGAAGLRDHTPLGILQFREFQTGDERESRERKFLFVSHSTIHGMGLFTKRRLRKGAFVTEYIGEVIRRAVADFREREYQEKGIGNYLFALENGTVVDATRKGGIARFVNHSCSPNLIADIVTMNDSQHVHFFCKRPIGKNEELLLDYSLSAPEGAEERSECCCGAENCRKYL